MTGPLDLVADVGNTRCHVALFQGTRLVARTDVRVDLAAQEQRATWDRFVTSNVIGSSTIARAAIASVNPEAEQTLLAWARDRGMTPFLLGRTLRPDLPVAAEPGRLGADRLAQGVWAARNFPKRAVLVASLGTAASFVVVTSNGALAGGAIAPGLALQTSSLSERTALLPKVSISTTPRAIGRDTVPAIEAGVYWGIVGLIEVLARKVAEELGETPVVVATGGDAELIARGTKLVERVVPDLTLEGVALALAEAPP